VAWATGHEEVVPRHGLSDQVRLTAGELHIDQTHVGTSSEDIADNFTRVGQQGPHLQFRVSGDQPCHRGSDGNLEWKGSGTHCETANVQPGQQLDLPPQIRLAGEYSCTALQKYVAKGSGLDTVGSAVEQPDSDNSFQRRDASRDRGLGKVQGLRGSRVVAEACQGECMLDEPEFDHDT
jgi:hypothetical protein